MALMYSLSLRVRTSSRGMPSLKAGAGGEEDVVGGESEGIGDDVDGGESLSVDVHEFSAVVPEEGGESHAVR